MMPRPSAAQFLLALPFCAAALTAAPLAANASCAQFTANAINVTYDPLGAQGVSQVVQPISLYVTRSSGNGASLVKAQFVDWDSNTRLRIGARGPIYTIEDHDTVVTNRYSLALLPNQYFHYVIPPKTKGGSGAVNGLQFFIDPGQDIPAGVYDETLDMRYSCQGENQFDHSVEWQPGVLHVSVNVPSKLVANLSGGSTSGTLDFGDFTDHARSAMVNVYSTGPFTVKVDSDNHGRMVLDGATHPDRDAQISYGLLFAGFPVRLGSPMHFFRTGIGGGGFPLAALANDVHGKRAGIYRDTLTVTITPTAF